MVFFLSKNHKRESDSQPALRLVAIYKENEGDEESKFVDIMSFWESKSGKGFKGSFNNRLDIEKLLPALGLDVMPDFEKNALLNKTKEKSAKDVFDSF